tara:strand:+ start:748 stop:1131 length:384 start_codon:yes stop_codon:yes gene_type:complete
MKFIRNMLFNTGRYPSTMGAGGQQDLDFCRYLEWMWFKRCFALLGFAFALGAGGLYVGMYHAEYVTETAIWAWGVAWIYNGFILVVLALSTAITIIKSLILKAFFTEEIHAAQSATRTMQLYNKGRL